VNTVPAMNTAKLATLCNRSEVLH